LLKKLLCAIGGTRAGLPVVFGLGAVLILAVLLRCWDLDWGLPHAGRFYFYHPDEPVLLDAICRVNPLWGEVTPGFYNYGSLYILLVRLAHDFAAPVFGWGAVPRFQEPFAAWATDFSRLALTGRWVSAALGAATVAVVFLLARRLYGIRTGWLAALFLAVSPLAAVLAHFVAVDVPATFFTTLTLLLAAVGLQRIPGGSPLPWLLFAGFAAGLATGTKYNSFPALFAVGVPLAVWFQCGRRRGAAAAAAGAAAACGAGFLLATPGALLDSQKFQADLLYELGRNREGQGLVFAGTPPALFYHLGISLPVGMEWPLFLLSLAGVAWAARRRRAEDWLLLAFLIPFFLLLLPAERKFLRYVAPMLPVLVVLAARLVDEGLRGRRRPMWLAAAGVAFGAALASSAAHTAVFRAPDARDAAAAFLAQAAAPGDVVALASDPWYYTPPVHPTAGAVKVGLPYGGPPAWDARAAGEPRPDLYDVGPYRLLAPQSYPRPQGTLPIDTLRRYSPRFVVMSDFEWEDPARLRRQDAAYRHPTLDLLDVLETEYVVATEFRPRPTLGPFTWWRRGLPPHDWRYQMPVVRIYERVP
jgi:4-amino-4-deoxy-L-arabinose transferase-like glycosyltransferase